MKKIYIFLLCINTLCYAAELSKPNENWKVPNKEGGQSSWGISGTSQTVGMYRNNTGNGANTDINGNNIRQELSLKARGKLGKGDAGVEMSGRGTNDNNLFNEKAEFLYFRSFYKDKEFDVQVGDVAQTYNPLLFSGTVKGTTLGYTQDISKKRFINYSLIAGVQTGTWADLSAHKRNHRNTVAAQVRYQHATAQSMSVSISGAKDSAGSDTNALVISPNEAQAISLGLQVNWRFNRYIKIKSDIAYSNTDANNDANSSGLKKEDKFAGRITLYTKPSRSVSSNFKYERYDTGFNTLVGASTQDRERLENTTTWQISSALKSRMTLKGSRDDLDGSQGESQNIFDVVATLGYRPSFLKRGDIDFRVQQTSRSGRGDKVVQQNAGIAFTNRLKTGWTYALSYDYTKIDNSNDTNLSNALQTVRAKLAWKKKYNENNNFRASIKADISFYEDEVEDRKRFGGTVDMGWDYGRKFMLDLLATSKNTDRDLSVDSSYELFQLISQYKIFGDSSHVLKLNLQSRHTDSGRIDSDFKEEEARLSYSFAF